MVAAIRAAAWAGDGFDPPDEGDALEWPALVAAVIAVLAILVLAFKNSKRTHLD